MSGMAIYFFIILLFGYGYRVHSFIILSSCLIGIAIPDMKDESLAEFLRCVNTSILLDSVTALILSMMLFFDKVAWKQAVLLSFATIAHIMVILDITTNSTAFSLFFYNYYDELIITVGIFQMMVSMNGFNTALRNLWECLSRVDFNLRCYSKNIPLPQIHKTRS